MTILFVSICMSFVVVWWGGEGMLQYVTEGAWGKDMVLLGPMLRVGNPQHSPKHRQGWHVAWVSGKEGCGTCVIWVRSWEVACLA